MISKSFFFLCRRCSLSRSLITPLKTPQNLSLHSARPRHPHGRLHPRHRGLRPEPGDLFRAPQAAPAFSLNSARRRGALARGLGSFTRRPLDRLRARLRDQVPCVFRYRRGGEGAADDRGGERR